VSLPPFPTTSLRAIATDLRWRQVASMLDQPRKRHAIRNGQLSSARYSRSASRSRPSQQLLCRFRLDVPLGDVWSSAMFPASDRRMETSL
jgi:hypothetical protein